MAKHRPVFGCCQFSNRLLVGGLPAESCFPNGKVRGQIKDIVISCLFGFLNLLALPDPVVFLGGTIAALTPARLAIIGQTKLKSLHSTIGAGCASDSTETVENIMKKFLNLLVMAALAASSSFVSAQQAGGGAVPTYKAKSPKLNRAQFDALLAKPDQLVVIDVRRPDELINNGGFPVYLSIQAKDLEKSLAFIPKDRSVVTVSNHAGRAGRSADLLAEKGFKVAGAVGAQDYEAEGGTLTKIAPPQPKQAAN
ncbi:rhodanese-like domain-containing protein [Dechloromonas denitrificans]|uniref:rhodanese-like domain-containing protein n=1 Tax=Dechloromonas denitrificans TaxID=281362 RepID=UPI001CF80AB2|nr:rhodanese-like domain-containing protein [Dechloromonas denitrificans]